MTQTRTRPAYDAVLLEHDMTVKGWLATDLAKAAKVSDPTIRRFFDGSYRTTRTAVKLAAALGYPVRRYLIVSSAVARRVNRAARKGRAA
jgi:plasmid maintenance system antidote protein VapI